MVIKSTGSNGSKLGKEVFPDVPGLPIHPTPRRVSHEGSEGPSSPRRNGPACRWRWYRRRAEREWEEAETWWMGEKRGDSAPSDLEPPNGHEVSHEACAQTSDQAGPYFSDPDIRIRGAEAEVTRQTTRMGIPTTAVLDKGRKA